MPVTEQSMGGGEGAVRGLSQLLIVGEEAPLMEALAYSLSRRGFAPATASGADECRRWLRDRGCPAVVLLDAIRREGGDEGDGLILCRTIRGLCGPDVPILVLTAYAGDVGEAYRTRVVAAGASDCLVKPFSMAELFARLHDLLSGVPAAGEGAAPRRNGVPLVSSDP